MTKSATETTIHTIGLDIAKNSFSVHGFDAEGHTVYFPNLDIKLTELISIPVIVIVVGFAIWRVHARLQDR